MRPSPIWPGLIHRRPDKNDTLGVLGTKGINSFPKKRKPDFPADILSVGSPFRNALCCIKLHRASNILGRGINDLKVPFNSAQECRVERDTHRYPPTDRMRSAARSAIMTVVACVFPAGMVGMTDASTMRNPRVP